LKINGDVLLQESGTVLFNTNDDNIITAVDPENDVLTIGENQTLLTGPAAIAHNSNSRVIAAIVNEGTITADEGGLQFDGQAKVNNGMMNAANGGAFRVQGTEIDNTNGEINLSGGGQLRLSDGIIEGGVITGNGTIVSQSDNDHLKGPLEIGPGVTLSSGTYRIPHLAGEITNNGVMEITDTSAGVAYLRIDGDTSLLGSGKVVFNSNDDNYFDSVLTTDVLTNGPSHTLTTNPSTIIGESRLRMALVNQGLVEANQGGLTLDELPKTNNGVFRSTGGGELEVRNADAILTNYNAATGTLTGGRWEAIGGVIDLQGASIDTIAPGTEVVISGVGGDIPQMTSLNSLEGTLRIDNGAVIVAAGDVALQGVLEFGLGDGAVHGFDSTGLTVEGDIDFTGCVIDVADLGLTSGGYEVINWSDTSQVTGIPTLRNVPPGTSLDLNLATGTLSLIIDGEPLLIPKILSVDYDVAGNTVTITYESVDGESFEVRGGSDLENLSLLPDTPVGNGAVMQYVHQPSGSPAKHFYQFFRK
jgi:hypothetical protein